MDKKYIKQNIILNSGNAEEKRAEIKRYFNTTYELYEKLFELLIDDSAFYMQPEPLRHPLIFYFGHTATFFINKLNISKIYNQRVNEYFESIFAIGVDEMSWDDLNPNNYNWPSVDEVREYRKRVKEIVNSVIDTLKLDMPIGWSSPWWVIMMGIEHERIHLETSSVLFRQLDIKYLKQNHPLWSICLDFDTDNYPKNELIEVSKKEVVLGIDRENPTYYGWDNEYGREIIEVDSFKASKYLVSNGEFLEFVLDSGYEKDEFWQSEGLEWKRFKRAKYPTFWIKEKDKFYYRALNQILPLPLDFPVDVNYHEAKAFCNWKSKKEGANYDLPTEEQWHSLYIEHKNSIKEANINLEFFASSCAVNRFKHGKFYDIIGNVWQWCNTPIYPFNGFEVHPVYDDFSTPTFDNRHNIIKGGSFISTGNEALPHSRYAFRRHFFQHAGFRYVVNSKNSVRKIEFIEQDNQICKTIENSYSHSYFKKDNIYKFLAEIGTKYATKKDRALDINCQVGRVAFELAKEFKEVVGLDFSARFIKVAVELQKSGIYRYRLGDEVKKVTLDNFGISEFANRCIFYQADASNLKPIYRDFDLILTINTIENSYNPRKFLNNIKDRLNKGGVVVLASSFDFSINFTPKEQWLCIDDVKNIFRDFELIDEFSKDYVEIESEYLYKNKTAKVLIWKK